MPSVTIPRAAAALAKSGDQFGCSRSRQLIGVCASSSRLFGSLDCQRAGTQSGATAIKIGQLVGASTVVTGIVVLAVDALTVSVQSVRIDTGRVAATFD